MTPTNNIFLPLIYGREGLYLVHIETFGRPIRYFHKADDELLSAFWNVFHITDKTKIKVGDPIVQDERCAWGVSYVLLSLSESRYLKNPGAGLAILKLESLDDVFKNQMPGELQLALISVITKELTEEETV